MKTLAEALGKLDEPLRLAKSGQRLMVDAHFSYCWADAKLMLGLTKDNITEAKAILRSQGSEQFFVRALEIIVKGGWPLERRQQDDRLQRFKVALRFAEHLSPDEGRDVRERLVQLTDSRSTTCPLAFVKAFQAHLVNGQGS